METSRPGSRSAREAGPSRKVSPLADEARRGARGAAPPGGSASSPGADPPWGSGGIRPVVLEVARDPGAGPRSRRHPLHGLARRVPGAAASIYRSARRGRGQPCGQPHARRSRAAHRVLREHGRRADGRAGRPPLRGAARSRPRERPRRTSGAGRAVRADRGQARARTRRRGQSSFPGGPGPAQPTRRRGRRADRSQGDLPRGGDRPHPIRPRDAPRGRGERAQGRLRYDRDLFDAPTAERLVSHFERLLDGAVARPEATVRELPCSAKRSGAPWSRGASSRRIHAMRACPTSSKPGRASAPRPRPWSSARSA